MFDGVDPVKLFNIDVGPIHSFGFAVNKFFMKLLKITNIEIIKYCQEQFDFHLPSDLIARRTKKFHSQIAGFNS